MTTNTTPGFPPSRRDPRQVSNTLRLTMNYSDTGVSTGEGFFSSLPAGAFITDVKVDVVIAFNAVTTNVITVGTNTPSYNNFVASGDVSPTSTGTTSVSRGWGNTFTTTDTPVFATYAQTGTSATTGQAVICITFEGGWAS